MDALTFQTEVLRIERLLYHVAYTSLGTPEDCADAVQEALLRAWKKRASLKDEKAFKAWMVRILVNSMADARRKKHIVQEELSENLTLPEHDSLPLREALQKLPRDMRYCVVLVYLEGCTMREAAQMLSIPEGTVKSRLSRARILLRNYLSEEE